MVAETQALTDSSEVSAIASTFRERANKLKRSAAINLLQIALLEGTYTVDAFEKLASVLTPSGIDFATSPISPADQAFDLAKHLVTSQKHG